MYYLLDITTQEREIFALLIGIEPKLTMYSLSSSYHLEVLHLN